MKNNPELLQKLLEKIKNTPDDIIENAIDDLSEKIQLENYIYDTNILNKFNLESENNTWKENLSAAA